ncbi:MAG: hypothetical protein AAGH15_19930 [Myxococcota bacterium]
MADPDFAPGTPLVIREALLMPLRWLRPSLGLPPTTLLLEFDLGPPQLALLTSDRARYERMKHHRAAAFDPVETELVARAGEAGVLTRHRFLEWVEWKEASLDGWKLTGERIGHGARDSAQGYWAGKDGLAPGHELLDGWTVARLCACLGARLVEIDVEGEAVVRLPRGEAAAPAPAPDVPAPPAKAEPHDPGDAPAAAQGVLW